MLRLLRKIYSIASTALLLIILMGCRHSSPTQQVAAHPTATATHTALAPHVEATPTVLLPSQPQGGGVPARLVISEVGIDALVEAVGIGSNGDLATPIQHPWEDVGWYNNGPRPGETGSAVIDGHLDRPGGYAAVFWKLRYLHVGSSVTIVDKQGRTRHFRVMRMATYPPKEAPLQQIFGNAGGAYLNLITCSGDWIPSQHQTTLRLVVYTELIP